MKLPSGGSFLLLAGRAHALLYGLEGQKVLLQEFQPCDLFGTIGELEPRPQDADVVAMEASRAAVFLSPSSSAKPTPGSSPLSAAGSFSSRLWRRFRSC